MLPAFLRLLALCAVFSLAASAQRRVNPSELYERTFVVLPMVGKGTWEDPKRPLFMPAPDQMKPSDRSGILAYHFQVSDDGKFALVEIVTTNKLALAPVASQIRAQQAPGIQLFDSAARSRGDVERAFKLLKRDFDMTRFQVVVP